VLPSNITSIISTSDLANADDCAFDFDTI